MLAPQLVTYADALEAKARPWAEQHGSVAHLLAERIPDARLVTVAGGTHSFASERAEEVAAIIRSHLG